MKLSAPKVQAEWLNQHLRSRVQASIAGTQYLQEYLDSGAGTPEQNQSLQLACFNQAVWEGRHAAIRWLIEFVGIQANAKWEAVATMKRQATEDPSNAKLAEKMKKKRFDVDIMVEFARESKDKRITLVLEATATPVRVLWALVEASEIDGAKEALSAREDCDLKHIGSWASGEKAPDLVIGLPEWAESRGIGAVVWTALPPKFGSVTSKCPSDVEIIAHLSGLSGAVRDNAEHYVRMAPRQIDTNYRRKIEAALHWVPTGNNELL